MVISIGSAVDGPGVLPAASYLALHDDPPQTGVPDHPALFLPAPGSPQKVAGVLDPSLDLGLSSGQTFFGFSLFGTDVTGTGTALAD